MEKVIRVKVDEEGKVKNRVWEMGEIDFFVVSRWILILMVLFIMGYNAGKFEYLAMGYKLAIAYVIFNIIVRFRIFNFLRNEKFLFLIFFFDILFVSLALYFSRGIDQNFFIIYLMTIVMAAMSSGLRSSFPVAGLSAVLYTWIVWNTKAITNFDDPAFLLRIPFLFLIAFMSGTWTDLMKKKIESKERAMREEILKMKNFYERIINSVNEGIIVLGKNGEIKLENPEVKALYDKGIEREELVREVLNNGRHRKVVKLNGRFVEILVSLTRNGEESITIGIVRDVTRIKEMEEELEHSRRLADIGKMASYIAHEVRNPLGIIKGIAQIIQMKFDMAELNELTGKIFEGVERVDRIIEDILDFSRKKPLDIKEVDLEVLIKDIVNSIPVQKKRKEHNVKIEMISNGESFIVSGDKIRLQRAFENLIVNGIEAVDSGGYVKVLLQREKDNVVVKIIDNGCGIKKEDLKRIFEPFYTRKQHGTGLGLSIVKTIINNHGGEISIMSEEGKGTVFTVCLPSNSQKSKKEVNYESVNS